MSSADEQRLYVVSYKEIAVIFITFALIFVFLFPKDILKDQLLKAGGNYNLSVLYLKNMIAHDKLDEELVLILAQKSDAVGKKDLAAKLTKVLLQSKRLSIRKKAVMLHYKLLKEEYYYLQTEAQKQSVKEELIKLLKMIVSNNYYEKTDLLQWYGESIFLQQDKYAFELLQKILQQESEDKRLLIQGFSLAQKLGKSEEALQIIHKLEDLDQTERDKWLMNEYYYLQSLGNEKKAEALLQREAKRSRVWKIRLAQFYIAKAHYKKAFAIYQQLFQKTDTMQEKKKYFREAIRSLRAGSYTKEAVLFASQYEDLFIDSRSMRAYILKLYVSSDELTKAVIYAKKILLKYGK